MYEFHKVWVCFNVIGNSAISYVMCDKSKSLHMGVPVFHWSRSLKKRKQFENYLIKYTQFLSWDIWDVYLFKEMNYHTAKFSFWLTENQVTCYLCSINLKLARISGVSVSVVGEICECCSLHSFYSGSWFFGVLKVMTRHYDSSCIPSIYLLGTHVTKYCAQSWA